MNDLERLQNIRCALVAVLEKIYENNPADGPFFAGAVHAGGTALRIVDDAIEELENETQM